MTATVPVAGIRGAPALRPPCQRNVGIGADAFPERRGTA